MEHASLMLVLVLLRSVPAFLFLTGDASGDEVKSIGDEARAPEATAAGIGDGASLFLAYGLAMLLLLLLLLLADEMEVEARDGGLFK